MENLTVYLISAPFLGFVLGLLGGAFKANLRIPEQVYQALSIYLLFSIGMKGGSQFVGFDLLALTPSLIATFIVGISTPLIAYALFRKVLRLTSLDSTAIACHYGSVSAATFLVGSNFLNEQGMSYEPYFPAIVAILEIIGIVAALFFFLPSKGRRSNCSVFLTILRSKGVFVLVGAFLIGALVGKEGAGKVGPLFFDPFQGVLVLFLIELGFMASEQIKEIFKRGIPFVLICIVVTLLNGLLGIALGALADLSFGGIFLLGLIASSASYIAAPAVVRDLLPNANPSIYLAASLGVTFPFNLAIGIPIYLKLAHLLQPAL